MSRNVSWRSRVFLLWLYASLIVCLACAILVRLPWPPIDIKYCESIVRPGMKERDLVRLIGRPHCTGKLHGVRVLTYYGNWTCDEQLDVTIDSNGYVSYVNSWID